PSSFHLVELRFALTVFLCSTNCAISFPQEHLQRLPSQATLSLPCSCRILQIFAETFARCEWVKWATKSTSAQQSKILQLDLLVLSVGYGLTGYRPADQGRKCGSDLVFYRAGARISCGSLIRQV